jgi:hypothetical protein
MRKLIYNFRIFWTVGFFFPVKQEVSHRSTSLLIPLDRDPRGLNPDLSVETKDLDWERESMFTARLQSSRDAAP